MSPIYISKVIKDFPSVDLADENGLIAVGGDYNPDLLLKAYKSGIFPWYDHEVCFSGFKRDTLIYWFSPKERFVIFPDKFRVERRLMRYYNRSHFKITYNSDFRGVMKLCQETHKRVKGETWISDKMIDGYSNLFAQKYATSVEVWDGDTMVGGLYGILINKYFCGESMFSLANNASKFAFIRVATDLFQQGIHFIDCEIYSENFDRFGGENIPREKFLLLLQKAVNN